jgi:hypothetical protein
MVRLKAIQKAFPVSNMEVFRFQNGSIKRLEMEHTSEHVDLFLFQTGSIKGFQALYAPGAPEPLAPRGTG